MLEELARQKAGKVVLEVELPEDSLKKRRIGFYERHGFTFNEYPYIQPPMGEDRHEIPCGSCQHRNRFQRMSFRACAQNYTKVFIIMYVRNDKLYFL